MLEHREHEERIAFRLTMQQRRQVTGTPALWRSPPRYRAMSLRQAAVVRSPDTAAGDEIALE
jgi:hypothetical protein